MPRYRCLISEQDGKIHKGIFTASSRESLVNELRREGKILVECREMGTTSGRRISIQTLLDFTSSLALMMNAGLSVKDSLTLGSKGLGSRKSKDLNDTIGERLQKGDSFHLALSQSCSNLPPLYLGLISIGERIGSLKQIMNQLQSFLEDRKKFRDLVIGSMIYPAFVTILVLLAALLASLFVIPAIQDIIQQLGTSSPEIDTLILKLERFRSSSLLFVPTFSMALLSLYILRRTNSAAALVMDRILIRIPLIRTLVGESEYYNILYSLQILSANGISLEDALTQSAAVLKNKEIQSQLIAIREKIKKGELLSKAFYESSAFPDRISQWISFGESTGNVETIFTQLSDYYKNSIEKRMKLIMTMVEPAMIIGIGIFMLVFVINVVIPLVTIYGSVL